ncbi:MAG: 16S rRNA (cytosine(1402)-N(4))-methyltransferase RsmH [Gemmatimonadota bacterium]|nr:16S rRNA (cytosine(1402)-N(4))-methyltransferase RsmH [Gemmatimonadota bacterium]
MVREVLAMLRPERGGIFLDGTLGGGGHAEAVLEHDPEARLVGVDRDPEALREAADRLARYGERFRVVRANFADAVGAAGIAPDTLAGALLDLGISSHQIDEADRGFTFRPGARLDMRMEGGTSSALSAAELLNTLPEAELADLFWRWGEERRSRRLARVLVEMREREAIETSDQLVAALKRSLGPRTEVGDRARIFQALRIAVNDEIGALQTALPLVRDVLAPGGVFVVLSYHSLEDRVVKNSFRDWSQRCTCPVALPVCVCGGVAAGTLLTRKPISAGADEVAANPRARSARLRAWRRA